MIELDASNKYMVGVKGDEIVILNPNCRILSKQQALNLAAWLVTLADDNDEFGLMIEKVQNA